MNWWKYYNSLFLLTFTAVIATAQTWQELRQKHPGYNEYILEESQSYSISVVKDKLHVTSDNYYESVILSDLGIHNNQESFVYSQLIPVKSFEAYSVITNNGKERKVPISRAVDAAVDQRNIFHSDVKEKKLTFAGLHVGARKVYKYQNEFVDPYLLHRFIFNNYYPAKEYKLEIQSDKNIDIGYRIFNDPNNSISFSKTERKGKWIYTWTLSQTAPFRYEDFNPGYLYSVPHIIFFIENYTLNNEKVPVLGTVDLLYEYYKNFTENLNKTEDENLKRTTLGIIEGLNSNDEKIKAIYYWVQNNIKYVAFEEAYQGFIPREAKLVYERKFGDCKDMSSIITEMAKYAEIPNVNLTWIGSRNIPYTYHEVPTPAVDDHMIATYEKPDGSIYFLDATDSFTKFGLPSYFIQGKEAMIQNGNTYKLVKVPVVKAAENLSQHETEISLDGNLLKGKSKAQIHGLAKTQFLSELGDAQNKTRQDLLKTLLELGNNKFRLKNFTETHITEKDLPYQVDFNFELDNYAIQAGNETYLNLFLEKPFQNVNIANDRQSDYDFDYLIKNQYSVRFKIPEGVKISYYPKDFSASNDLLDYEIRYTVEEDEILLDFRIETKKLLLKKSDFDLWNQTLNELKSHYNETIIITKI
ncbi:DUF3857 domain-containing protein [Moheibacter sp.]|uniref:DUF3857 domain-containing protein n=1 Tax=Moheibacter sp. TaxID=1965316 RepID=UPI003C770CD2